MARKKYDFFNTIVLDIGNTLKIIGKKLQQIHEK